MPERCVAALCNNVTDPENNISLHRRFLNLCHRHQSRGHFEHVILVISDRDWLQENRILNFVKIRKKIAFYPNRKIFSQKLIRWNVELDEQKKKFWHYGHFKGARSCYFRWFCLILLIMSSERQIGGARVFHMQNHGHITTENDFPAVQMTFWYKLI